MSSREILARLVSFDTVSSGSNLALIDFVADYLAGHGIESHRVPDPTGTKAALFAQVGPDVPGGVILSGHTDVVPVEGQDWSSDPFTLTERNGRLYGRGSADMKGFLAIALAAVPAMRAAGLKRPIQLALSYDEEVGCIGAPPMIAAMRETLPIAACAIIGEPTLMKVVTGHKAIVDIDTHVRGHEVHSSLMHTGVSAVMAAAELVAWTARQTEDNRARAEALPDPGPYDPPWTTLHCGKIRGGTAHNITARDCWIATDIRSIPGEDIDDWINAYLVEAAALESRLKAVRPEAAITVTVNNKVPGCAPEADGAAEALARALTGDNGQHVVSYATEAGQFQEAGYSAVVCGPGSIEQAHQADEYISLDQLAAGDAFVARLIARLSA
ncbi:acetylornithine deacetylase [Halovulum dunhuangense]|uniref:Acetylornithine deacetylase n=1 Tax=Halovulum dunhuangense TaxID=1505036 RepID=A0A849L4N8_9RHOB|nr:acetylornithine deacetylase [Halovulum dunhuangense]NNU81107.1 acetylornithine deacetylase [Halovulum dunhuangense]